MGDYRGGRGDFYRGDPGFLSFLGKGLGLVGGLIPGVGGLISRAGGAIASAGARKALPAAGEVVAMTPAAAGRAALGGIYSKGVAAVRGHPVLSAAGAAGVLGAGAGMLAGRISKRTGLPFRRRRMRVTNVKALRRSLRRIHGFERIARKVVHFTHPRRAVGRAAFRFRRKKKVC